MDIKKVLLIFSNYINRNNMILAQTSRKALPKTVNLHWWDTESELQNVGDFISPVVFEYMKQQYEIKENTSKTRHIYAIGSIIDAGYQNATVWGSGLLRGERKYWWRKLRSLDVRCVRGPETRKVLIQNGYKCPEIYGDPALLMPLIYQPKNVEKRYDYRVVRHYFYSNGSGGNEISPMVSDWRCFIEELVQSKLIISSSLHGVILAEAYGIPAILLCEHDMNLFKYNDYYHSTGRYEFPIARSVEEALSLTPAQIPDFSVLQKGLIGSFPNDLWK